MGHLLSSFFLAISSNVDNFAVGVAYGVKKIKIGILSNLVIAVISASGTSFSMSIGEIISKFLPAHVAKLLGSGALLAIGVWGIWDTLRTQRQEKRNRNKSSEHELSYNTFIQKPERADLDNSRTIDVKESVTIAFAVTINNLAGGIGGGISGLNIAITTVITFVISMLGVPLGYFLGASFAARMSGKWSGILSACMIICIAVYEYFS